MRRVQQRSAGAMLEPMCPVLVQHIKFSCSNCDVLSTQHMCCTSMHRLSACATWTHTAHRVISGDTRNTGLSAAETHGTPGYQRRHTAHRAISGDTRDTGFSAETHSILGYQRRHTAHWAISGYTWYTGFSAETNDALGYQRRHTTHWVLSGDKCYSWFSAETHG